MTPARLRAVIAVAGRAGLPARRTALLAALPPGVRHALESDSRPTDQLRVDLNQLNEWKVERGRHPLDIWIEAAVDMLAAEGRVEAKALRRLAAGGPLPLGLGARADRRRWPWLAAALALVAGLGFWLWSRASGDWIAIPPGARAPGPGDLMARTDQGWQRVAGPCVPRELVRTVDDGERRVVDAAALERAVWAAACDEALAAAATEQRALTVVLEVRGPAHAPQRAEAWFGKRVGATWTLEEAL